MVENFFSGRKVAFAHFTIHIARMRVFHGLSAVVDSGSPFTTISTRDALSFGLPIKHWQSGELTRLAGNRFYKYELEADAAFRTADNKTFHCRHNFRVLIPTKIDEATIREVQPIPSLIGTDLLEDNKFAFVFDPSSELAYLERADVLSPSPHP